MRNYSPARYSSVRSILVKYELEKFCKFSSKNKFIAKNVKI